MRSGILGDIPGYVPGSTPRSVEPGEPPLSYRYPVQTGAVATLSAASHEARIGALHTACATPDGRLKGVPSRGML
jgi:hypothetical protein